MTDPRQKVTAWIGSAVMVLSVLAALVGLVFVLTGMLDTLLLRWWATLATLAIPGVLYFSWTQAGRSARERIDGFQDGVSHVEKTMSTIGRGAAGLRRETQARPASATAEQIGQFDDLITRDSFQILDAPRSKSGQVDM